MLTGRLLEADELAFDEFEDEFEAEPYGNVSTEAPRLRGAASFGTAVVPSVRCSKAKCI